MKTLIELVKSCKGTVQILLVASSNRQAHPEGKMTSDLLEDVREELYPFKLF